MYLSEIENRPPKVTSPDGEILQEIFGHQIGGIKSHSLAEVTIPPGMSSTPHFHKTSEETYLILSGQADMVINQDHFTLESGDAILIQPHEVHQIFNRDLEDLVFLAVCVPAWQPEDNYPTDTEL